VIETGTMIKMYQQPTRPGLERRIHFKTARGSNFQNSHCPSVIKHGLENPELWLEVSFAGKIMDQSGGFTASHLTGGYSTRLKGAQGQNGSQPVLCTAFSCIP